jgi:hypothetical protein
MTNEDIVRNRYTLADEGMRLNLASLADLDSALNLNEWSDHRLITDFAAEYVHEFGVNNPNPITEYYIWSDGHERPFARDSGWGVRQ